jgi:AraC family transcriptional regulator
MENQEIRIISLPPMRVVSFYAFSENPEIEAWGKVVTWAKAHSLWKLPPETRIFGFDNPTSSEGSPNRGYEFWLTIGSGFHADEQIKIKEFSGGLYGVTLCDVTSADPFDVIPASWQKLVRWLETSHYKHGNHQWLEEHLTRNEIGGQNFILDLYIPIAE